MARVVQSCKHYDLSEHIVLYFVLTLCYGRLYDVFNIRKLLFCDSEGSYWSTGSAKPNTQFVQSTSKFIKCFICMKYQLIGI